MCVRDCIKLRVASGRRYLRAYFYGSKPCRRVDGLCCQLLLSYSIIPLKRQMHRKLMSDFASLRPRAVSKVLLALIIEHLCKRCVGLDIAGVISQYFFQRVDRSVHVTLLVQLSCLFQQRVLSAA